MTVESVRKAYDSLPYVTTAADLVDEIAALRMQVEGLERENEILHNTCGQYEEDIKRLKMNAEVKNYIE